jgi:glycosyltransferase involved in cell wall biosynthesis
MIDKKIKNNKVKAIKLRYIDAIPTILLNQLENKNIKVFRNDKIDIPIILLFGYWGPQKDLEFALNTLNEIKKDGFEFYLKLSGEINNHFKDYRKRYYELIEKYKGIIRELKGYVEEREILNLFTSVDLLLLTYNTPGGFSGVLDLAITFDLPVICIDFPEYREQAKGHTNVILVKREDFKDAVKDFIIKFKPVQSKTINVKEKINESKVYIKEIFENVK